MSILPKVPRRPLVLVILHGFGTNSSKVNDGAAEVADAVIEAIESRHHALIVVNFANGDMLGHTAKRHALLSAVETLDREAGRVLQAAERTGYSVLLTADHGNCEEMIDPYTGAPHTQHTTYPVPCLLIDRANWQLSSEGGLANVAPTVLQLMGLPTPQGMDATSLLLRAAAGAQPATQSEGRSIAGGSRRSVLGHRENNDSRGVRRTAS